MRHLSKKQKLELSKAAGMKEYPPVFKKRGPKLPTAKKVKAKNKNGNSFKAIHSSEKKKILEAQFSSTKPKINVSLNSDQQRAIEHLKNKNKNVFLTGAAGTGKSFVINEYLSSLKKKVPVLATTGAAAILVNGITFHRFFGLRLSELEDEAVIQRAYEDDRVRKRILETSEVVIDEVSMLRSRDLVLASEISKKVKNNSQIFGGIRIVLTGDFFQLPPVIKRDEEFESGPTWIFQSEIWKQLDPVFVELCKPMRTDNEEFIKILNKVRYGICDQQVKDFLNSRYFPPNDKYSGTVVYAKKEMVENHNKKMLESVDSKTVKFDTEVVYAPNMKKMDTIFKDSPIPEVLFLKVGAIVMIRKNDPDGRYVNGSIGKILKISSERLTLALAAGKIELEKESFEIKNGDGGIIATITNFPIVLGWAITIHKSQGTSLDHYRVNISGLWESGQAYVALSRAKNPKNMIVESWSQGSIFADQEVVKFYHKFGKSNS